MDLNSRINWLPGMEITAQTFIGLEEKLDKVGFPAADCHPCSIGKYADGHVAWDGTEL